MEYLTISGAQQEVKSTTIAKRKRTTGRSLRLVFVAVLLNLFLMKKNDHQEVDEHSHYNNYCSSGGVDVGVDDL